MPSSQRSSVESRNAPNARALARHPRVAAVEGVHDRADDEGDAAEEVELLPDQRRGQQVEREAGQRDRVGRQPRVDQAVSHHRAPLDRRERRDHAALASRRALGGRRRAHVAGTGACCGAPAGTCAGVRKVQACGRSAASGARREQRDARDEQPEHRVDQEVVGGDHRQERDEERPQRPEDLGDAQAHQARQRPAEDHRAGDVHRGHGGVGVEEDVRDRAVAGYAGDLVDRVDEAPLGQEARRRGREQAVADQADRHADEQHVAHEVVAAVVGDVEVEQQRRRGSWSGR